MHKRQEVVAVIFAGEIIECALTSWKIEVGPVTVWTRKQHAYDLVGLLDFRLKLLDAF